MNPLEQKKLSPELLCPLIDRPKSWSLAKLPVLGSEHVTFLWRLMHNILPTKERVNRLTPSTTPHCRLCQDQTVETLQHALNAVST